MDYTIRTIQPQDNPKIEAVIRSCLIEYGANHEGTAWTDPDLGRFSEIYAAPGREYWVAVSDAGEVVGGVGVGELEGAEGVCELQKMYCLPEVRGTGLSHQLMDRALAYAAAHYDRCYLETLDNMTAAQRFYKKYGFARIDESLGNTGHFNCDVRYLKSLSEGDAC